VNALSILVAEDNRVNRMLMASLLGKLGHRYDIVDDGAEAVAAVENGSYDLVLMDVRMPVVDGFEATRHIRALGGAAAAIPIIALTADAMAGDRERSLAAGMNGYLAKPIDLDALTAAIETVVAG
jgi:CheY-like chemotaxis protein